MNRCYSCFTEYDGEFDICPNCGTAKDISPKEPIDLFPGTVLENRYIIGESVGSGGFGIIYKAYDTKLETIVAVKEFFVSRLMTRAAGTKDVIINKKSQPEFEYRKNRFLAEARNMAKFGTHRSIPNVFEFFECNGTAYIVMELLHGQGLNQYLQCVNAKVDPDFVIMVANQVGNALISLHNKGIIHRDVAPDNIYICSDKDIRIKLLDLGAAKLADTDDDVIDIILKPGYSPAEQYDNTKNIGVWTDVYALGATLYVMLTGIKPDESTNRKISDTVIPPHELDSTIPENLSNAVMKAMANEKHLRFKSVDDFLKAINGNKKVVPLEKEKKRRKFRRTTGVIAACLVLLIIAGGLFHIYRVEQAKHTLKDANISIWFSLKEGSNEEEAIKRIVSDFTSKYPNVTVEIKAIPESDYETAIESAMLKNSLPTLFESTDLPDKLLTDTISVDNILGSEQAENCLFLNQYDSYYNDDRRLPLAIEIPTAYVITGGATSIDYQSQYFSSVEDFGETVKVATDPEFEYLWKTFSIPESQKASKEDFMDNESNHCAVMLSSSMTIGEIKEVLKDYRKTQVFPNTKEICCAFVYEWSISNSSKREVAAAEKLLSWMLGNSYQNTLMISTASDGQIPVNFNCFKEKITYKDYAPIDGIYNNFVFKK